MALYTTYEEPFPGRVFTEDQMHEVYRDMADKEVYPVFDIWLQGMLKSGVFETAQRSVITYNKYTNKSYYHGI